MVIKTAIVLSIIIAATSSVTYIRSAGTYALGLSASEPVIGLVSSDFTVTNCRSWTLLPTDVNAKYLKDKYGNILHDAPNPYWSNWALIVTPARKGTVKVSLPANVCHDESGNGNVAMTKLLYAY